VFDRFKNRFILRGTLRAETALYIGAGQESFTPLAVQGSLLKNVQGEPYIPGSSLKGVLRSFLESISDKGDCVCCGNKLKGKRERDDKIAELKRNGDRDDGDALLAEYIDKNSCLACRLFGSGIMAGKLKFADAQLENSDAWIRTELRTGNAIDRDTHTTATSALFDTEVIPSGTKFSFRIAAENLGREELLIFGEIVQYFTQGGISVGGRSRAGLGQVSVSDISAEYHFIQKGSFSLEQKKMENTDNDIPGALVSLLGSEKEEAPCLNN